MQLILFDGQESENLLPLTFTRPVGELRWGMLTIAEKWERDMGLIPSYLTAPHLQEKYPCITGSINLYVNGALCPNLQLIEAIEKLEDGQALVAGNTLLAFLSSGIWTGNDWESEATSVAFEGDFHLAEQLWHLIDGNGKEMEIDFERLTKGRKSQAISKTNTLLGNRIFLEEGAKVEACILNSQTGPIYLAADSEIMEGCVIRGPFALGEHAQVKMAAKIYGPVSAGPECRLGGEISSSILLSHSNKGHDGFLGHSYLGQWCNLGADTNNSNLKNNYDQVKLWSYTANRFVSTGQQFLGLIMGDHSKSGINTMFNTGTVVGVSANVFGAGFPRNFIPSFSWGGAGGITEYKLDRAFETAERVMARRKIELDSVERDILTHIYEATQDHRKAF